MTPLARRFYQHFHEESVDLTLTPLRRSLPIPTAIHSTQIRRFPRYCSQRPRRAGNSKGSLLRCAFNA
jgi:hypothetical protein